jgi:hypothetical protein
MRSRQLGFAHLPLIIAVAVVFLALVGFAGYRILSKNNGDNVNAAGWTTVTGKSGQTWNLSYPNGTAIMTVPLVKGKTYRACFVAKSTSGSNVQVVFNPRFINYSPTVTKTNSTYCSPSKTHSADQPTSMNVTLNSSYGTQAVASQFYWQVYNN